MDYAKRFCLQQPFIILVGNKVDLVDQQEISKEDIHALREKLRAEDNNILAYVQTSALTGNGVDKLFSLIKKGFKKDTVRIPYSFFAQQGCSVTDEEMAATYLANREDAQLASS